jgi:hypothetical protein
MTAKKKPKTELEKAGYQYITHDKDKQHYVLYEPATKKFSIWVANKNHPASGIVFRNTFLEFCRETKICEHERKLLLQSRKKRGRVSL